MENIQTVCTRRAIYYRSCRVTECCYSNSHVTFLHMTTNLDYDIWWYTVCQQLVDPSPHVQQPADKEVQQQSDYHSLLEWSPLGSLLLNN